MARSLYRDESVKSVLNRLIFFHRILKFRPDHDMALVDIVYHCCFRSDRWSARGGVVKSRRKSLKIHRHTDQLNYIVLAKYPSDGRVSAIRQPTPLPPS